jgi:hypothetical protein
VGWCGKCRNRSLHGPLLCRLAARMANVGIGPQFLSQLICCHPLALHPLARGLHGQNGVREPFSPKTSVSARIVDAIGNPLAARIGISIARAGAPVRPSVLVENSSKRCMRNVRMGPRHGGCQNSPTIYVVSYCCRDGSSETAGNSSVGLRYRLALVLPCPAVTPAPPRAENVRIGGVSA